MSPPRLVRSSSQGKKLPTHAKPTKPPVSKNNKRVSIPVQSTKSGAVLSKTVSKRDSAIEYDDDEMAGLPHFCAFCEKQIITPSGSILYCSESCRRKDSSKPMCTTLAPSSPISQTRSRYETPSTYVVPLRSPTLLRPTSITSQDTSFFDIAPLSARTPSEATSYLSQFQPSYSGSPVRKPRLAYGPPQRNASNGTLPSLSHTPASASSSYTSSTAQPLPSRTNPYGASPHSKSIDLVTPSSLSIEQSLSRSSASTSTAFRVVEGEFLSYDKKPCAEFSPSSGSLKQLFSHDAMLRGPKAGARDA